MEQKYWYASIGNVIEGYKGFDQVYSKVMKQHPFIYRREKNVKLKKRCFDFSVRIIAFQEITKEEFDLFLKD